MTLTLWLKYDHEMKKIIIYVNFMIIYINITDRQIYQNYSSEPHNINFFQKIFKIQIIINIKKNLYLKALFNYTLTNCT